MKKKNDMGDEEGRIEEGTRRLLKSIQHESLSPAEKENVWNRVEESVSLRKERTFSRMWLSLAASVTLLLLTGVGYLVFKKNSVRAMQETASKIVPDSEDTRLLLADDRTISLQKRNSDLVYKENGETIQIDSVSTIDQQIADTGQHFNTLIVPYGKRSTITLLDGTKIWLNSGSKLVYPAHFDADEREVYLEGQAYFSVSHSAEVPFYVHTKNMKVQVFGTEFDISAYDDDKQVSAVLASGSIELTVNEQSLFKSVKRKIAPGTRAVFTPTSALLETQQVNVEEFISWKDGYLLLKNERLSDLFKKLSRYYKVDISLKGNELDKKTFSGSFTLQEDIHQTLDIISASNSLHYQEKERRYIFEKNTIRP
jgi:transmembrane sensor